MNTTTTSYDVMDYDTSDRLSGEPSDALVQASLDAGDTGAVPAYLDDDGVWQYVRPDQVEHARRHQGRDVRTVYIES